MQDLEGQLDRMIETIEDPANRETARRFAEERLALGRHPGTVRNQLAAVRDLCCVLRDVRLEDATKEHLVAFMRQTKMKRRWRLRSTDGQGKLVERTEEVSKNTKAERAKSLRFFFKWLRGTDQPPPVVAWMKPNRRKAPRLKPSEILTRDEIGRLLDAARTSRDRALIALVAEAGLRAGEAASLRLGDVHPLPEGAVRLSMPDDADGLKTGARAVEVWDAAPQLMKWMDEHPARLEAKENGSSQEWREAPLFCKWRGGALTPHGIYDAVRRAAKRAGLRKPVFTHALRFAAATHDAKRGMPPAMMNVKYGWSETSKHSLYYSRMAQQDVAEWERQKRGLATAEAPDGSLLQPVACSRCELPNPPGTSFCGRCARPLTSEAEHEAEAQRVADLKALIAEEVRRAVTARS